MPATSLSAEKDLWRLWERRLPAGLRTREGRRVRVLFPGLPNSGPGPDYRGALLALDDEEPQRGDVELHLRASSWQAHGHHHDPHYNEVRLHVVLFDDGGPARTAQDRIVPVLTVGTLLESAAPPPANGGPCLRAEAPRPAPEALQLAMQAAGRDRFLDRVTQWEGECTVHGVSACVLRALLRCAGLGRNSEPCAALAEALDADTLEGLTSSGDGDARKTVCAVLLGMAGLLEAGAADEEEWRLWERYRGYWPARPLRSRDWQRFRLRPANRPERRLRIAAALMARDGLAGFLTRCANEVLREKSEPEALLALLAVPDEVVGRSWALETWTNVLLPLLAGYARVTRHAALEQRAWSQYAALPGGGENQTLTRMCAICGLARAPRLAIEQQGLLQIWQRYCSLQACAGCPLATCPP